MTKSRRKPKAAPAASPVSAQQTKPAVARSEAAEYARAKGAGGLVVEGSGLYRLLVESVRDYAIFALDPSGRIMSWNEGAQRAKGYSADEIIGKHFSSFYTPEDLAVGKPEMELKIAAAEGRAEDEGWRLRKDGTRFWANVVITALRDDGGTLVGFAKVTRDLTERRYAEERAVSDARRLSHVEASNRAKSDFLAAMSHELRTPLNAIGGYSELIQLGVGGPVTPMQQEYLERIRASQQHLLAIINDLLNYSRVESGQVVYDTAPLNLHDLLENVLKMVTAQAVLKKIHLKHGPCTESATAAADRLKVEQILLNLLSNAVKFTPVGGEIVATCGETVGFAWIQVRDTGPGIPTEKAELIFEPFVQLGRSLTSAHEGTGLGLAISRDLARAMKGDITVESQPGQGATFRLRLPRADERGA